MSSKRTAPSLIKIVQAGNPIVCVTAYDAVEAAWADAADVDVVLVGDSVANAKLGHSSTLAADMDTMIHHISAVRRGLHFALLVGDLPFGSYQSSVAQCVDNAVALVKAGAEAVKLEGAYIDEIRACVRAGIPVMGHVGMTPQSMLSFGGFKVQGKTSTDADTILQASLAIQDAGAFAVVLELIPADLAGIITEQLQIPTIGIGAGLHCNGQIQVISDLLGYHNQDFKHAKRYVDSQSVMTSALKQYAQEVRSRAFPNSENSF